MPRPFLILLFVLLALAPQRGGAQTLKAQSTPTAIWLDFKALASASPPNLSLPYWFDSLESDTTTDADGKAVRSNFRLRVRNFVEGNRNLLLRLFFDDVKGNEPVITGWSSSPNELFEYGPFGNGLNLPSSATVAVPVSDLSFVDITVPGDGSNLRGLFASALSSSDTGYATDFGLPASVADVFGNLPPTVLPKDDTLLYGRVRAMLDPGIVTLKPRENTTQDWEFELASPPFVAMLTFEILNADPLSPLEVTVNDKPLGPASMHTPDLADPGYQGVLRPLDRGVRFRYAGWLQSQKSIPGSLLHKGVNRVELHLPGESGPVAVRSLDLQLKNEWRNVDRVITP